MAEQAKEKTAEPAAAPREAPAPSEAISKEPGLPTMIRVGNLIAPRAPQTLQEAGLEEGNLAGLVLKLAYGVARFDTEWVAKQLHLSFNLVDDVLRQLCFDGMIEELWQTGTTSKRYRITQRGGEQAARLLQSCGYIGAAPVSLEAYAAMLRWQFAHTPAVRREHVNAALSGLVLPEEAIQLAGLAVSSGRSLFVYGPPGNGKSSIGRKVRKALRGDYWIPYCVAVGNNIIRLYDEQSHGRIDLGEHNDNIDHRWVRIKRPLITVGGELTLESLDLIYSPAMHYYEAPPHLKANGGVFLVDDFGRERVSPEQLLNRFITPMEHQIDYFTLQTGQKIMLPLRHVLIIATNLSPDKVTDPAFLRRMGYRLYLAGPTPEQYSQIFMDYAQVRGAIVTPEALENILGRYRAQNREPRACEPRDLIERARDICRFQNRPLELTPDVIDVAWTGYFGKPGTHMPDAVNQDGQPVPAG